LDILFTCADLKKMFYSRNFLLSLIMAIFLFGIFNLAEGYSMVDKTFPGFSSGFTLITSPTTKKEWTGFSSDFKDYDRIIAVNGLKILNVAQFDRLIQDKAPGVPVTYSFIKHNGIPQRDLFHTTIKTMTFSLNDFITTFFLTFISSLIYLFLSIFIILKGSNDNEAKALLTFTTLFGICLFTFYDVDLSHSYLPFVYVLQFFTVASLVQLGIIFNKNNFSAAIYNFIIRSHLYFSGLIVFLFFITALIIKNDLSRFPGFLELHLMTFNFFVYYLAGSFLSFCFLICYSYLKSPQDSLQKIRSRIILTGSLLSFLPYIVFWLIPSIFGHKASVEYLILTFLGFPFFITYAIIRYKAFDIEVFIRKGLIYGALSAIVLLSYFSISAFMAVLFRIIFNITGEAPVIASTVTATILASRLHRLTQVTIDKAFYRQRFDLTLLLEKFISDISNIVDRNELVNLCFSYLEQTVNPVSATLYLFNKQRNSLQLLHSNNGALPPEIAVAGNEAFFGQKDKMLLSLEKDKNRVGLLLLDKKKSEVEYLFEEKNFLKSFASTMAMALNTLLLKEEAHSLSVKNTELENKARFLNQVTTNLSHDLKFPIASGQTTVNKVLYLLNKKSYPGLDFIKESLGMVNRVFEKVEEYISISLDREMISLGKLVLNNEKIDLKKACEDAILLHSDFLEKKGKTIDFNFPEEDIFISGDRVRFENVISNLVSNAGKYGGSLIKLSLSFIEAQVLIEVHDNGPGIKETIKDKIFECYVQEGMLSNSGADRSTGLGLFICKTYIEMMKGSIRYESEPSRGTTFIITMPAMINSPNPDIPVGGKISSHPFEKH
jgi:signal transduction histidine kinase